MATEIVMPKLGWTMEEGTLVEWMKQDGDPIKSGEIMFTVESDKALQEVESFEDGIFRIPPNSDVLGKTLPVGTVLAYILKPGEAAPFEGASQSATQPPPQSSHASEGGSTQLPPLYTGEGRGGGLQLAPVNNGTSNGKSALPTISPRARRVAHELGVDWATVKGSGRTGRIVERDIRAVAASAPTAAPAQISPVAKRAAEDLGVDVNALAAQMPGQRITREHVERAATPPPQPSPVVTGEGVSIAATED